MKQLLSILGLLVCTLTATAQTQGFNADSVFLGRNATSRVVIKGNRIWFPNIPAGTVAPVTFTGKDAQGKFVTRTPAQVRVDIGAIGLSGISATTPLQYNSATGVFSILTASGAQNGALLSTDWTIFNNKQNALGYTPLNKAGDIITGDIGNTSTGFFRIPAGTTAQRPATPLDGMRRYNTTTLRDEFYANGSWQNHARLTGDTFTGVVSGLTAVVGTNTTQLATTAFVLANSASLAGVVLLSPASQQSGYINIDGQVGGRNGLFQTSTVSQAAVAGQSTAISNSVGVQGTSTASAGIGVNGIAHYGGWFTSVSGYGVFGQANGSGYGGYFTTVNGEGIFASANSTGIIARFANSTTSTNILTVNPASVVLTVPLTGTSATFSGNVTINNDAGLGLTLGRFSAGLPISYIKVSTSSTAGFRLQNHNGSDAIVVDGSNNLSLVGTLTGTSATFSGVISTPNNVNNLTIKAGTIGLQSFAVNNSWVGDNIQYSTTGGNFKAIETGTTSMIYFENGSIKFWVSGSTTPVTAGANFNTVTALGLAQTTGAATFISTVTATGFFESSDLRYKDIISRTPSASGFDMIEFKWKPFLKRDNKIHYGYVAQEVQKFMPNQVQTDDKGFHSVNYTDVNVKKISDLEQRILNLEKK